MLPPKVGPYEGLEEDRNKQVQDTVADRRLGLAGMGMVGMVASEQHARVFARVAYHAGLDAMDGERARDPLRKQGR